MHAQQYVLPLVWEGSISSWITWLSAAGAPKTTQRLRRGHLRMVALRSHTTHPVHLTLAMLVMICSDGSWSNEHRRSVRRSIISFLDWAKSNGLVPENPAVALPRVPQGPINPQPCPDRIYNEMLVTAGPRERMMIQLAAEVGMRRAEVAVCSREDLIEDLTGWSLLIHGKGNKQRLVQITDKVAEAIREYCAGGYLFPGQDNGHLSPAHVGKLVGDLMPKGWSMHKLRHRFATRSLSRTDDLLTLRDALGHTSVATTQIYTAPVPGKMRRLMEAAAND